MAAHDYLGVNFSKSIGTFDRLVISKAGGSDWCHLDMHVGHDVETIRVTFRSEEAIHDLYYALGRLLALAPKDKP